MDPASYLVAVKLEFKKQFVCIFVLFETEWLEFETLLRYVNQCANVISLFYSLFICILQSGNGLPTCSNIWKYRFRSITGFPAWTNLLSLLTICLVIDNILQDQMIQVELQQVIKVTYDNHLEFKNLGGSISLDLTN